jgi:chemotaxis protein MotB
VSRGRKRHPEHANHERWLVSYADFITLMFAFFVIMYAISKADADRFKAVSKGLKKAFGAEFDQGAAGGGIGGPATLAPIESTIPKGGPVPGMTGASSPNPGAATGEELKHFSDLLSDSLSLELTANETAKHVQLLNDPRGLVVRMQAKGFYDPGDVGVRVDALPVLDKIGKVLAAAHNNIRVEGHTDNGPTSSTRYPSNWELSTARASWLVRYLIQNAHVEPQLLEAAGFAEYRPLAPNDTEAGREKNRRVEILILGR